MRSLPKWLPCSHLILVLSSFFMVAATGCGVHQSAPIATASVAPLATEDLVAPCIYELVVAQPELPIKGVLVLFARADTNALYEDPSIRELTASLGYGLVYAHECASKSFGDLQPDASKGPGRALLQGLKQLAEATSHAELEQSPLFLYGFSAAGVLTATMADQLPGRVLGSIEYASGDAYFDLDHLQVSSNAARIPTLVLANAHDTQAGTWRNYHYFLRGREAGAPWAYAVQNATGHCCNLSTRSIIVPWITAIANARAVQESALTPQESISQAAAPASTPGATVQFACTPDGIVDAQGYDDCRFSAASLTATATSGDTSAWLPDRVSADAWLQWVTHASTN